MNISILKIKIINLIKWIVSLWPYNIIIFNMLYVSLLIIFWKVSIIEVISRTIYILLFFALVFIVIFLPRRWLIKNKKFRLMCLKLYRKYPEIFYIRAVLAAWTYNVMFICNVYIRYYLKRLVHLLWMGTGHKEIWPYKGEIVKRKLVMTFVMELWSFFIFIYLSILKIFYEIIYTYDRKSIKEIILSRIIGYLSVMGWFYIIGPNWFVIYIKIIIVIAIIYKIVIIIIAYKSKIKELKEANMVINKLEELNNIIVLHGFDFKIQGLNMYVHEKQDKTILMGYEVLKVSGNRIRQRYRKYLMPIAISSFNSYDLITKEYFIESKKYLFYTFDKNKKYSKHKVEYRYVTKCIAKFVDKYDYTIEEKEELEMIKTYKGALDIIAEFRNGVDLNENEIKKIINIEKKRYLLVDRKTEIGVKMFLLTLLLYADIYDEETYDIHMNKIVSNLWYSFIELKQFARMARKLKNIVEKNGGREVLLKKYYYGYIEKENDGTQLLNIIVKLIKEWEEKYDW